MDMTGLETEIKGIFSWLGSKLGEDFDCDLDRTKWVVKFTTLTLDVNGVVFDRSQNLVGLILVDDASSSSDGVFGNQLASIAYAAERSRAATLGLGRISSDWHLFIISDRNNLGRILAEATSSPRSTPYGISLLHPREPNGLNTLLDALQHYRGFLEAPGDSLPVSMPFLEVVRFFAPLLPYTRLHLLQGENPLANVELKILANWRDEIGRQLTEVIPGWPEEAKAKILATAFPEETVPPSRGGRDCRLSSLDYLEAGHFRALRLDGAIPFSKHTFITGGNGTGKTSVIEAIELGLTGTVARLDDIQRASSREKEIAMTNILLQPGRPICGKLGFSVECRDTNTGEYTGRTECTVDLATPANAPFRESFPRFALSQSKAAGIFSVSDRERYDQVLSLMGVQTQSLEDHVKGTQRSLNDRLRDVWERIGLSPQLLKVGSTAVWQRLHVQISQSLNQTCVWPEHLSTIGVGLDRLCDDSLALVKKIQASGTIEKSRVSDLAERWQHLSNQLEEVQSRHRLSDATIAKSFGGVLESLRDWRRQMISASVTSPKTPRSSAKGIEPASRNPETVFRAIEYLKQLRAYRELLSEGRRAVHNMAQKSRTMTIDPKSDMGVLLVQMHGSMADLAVRIPFLQESLEKALRDLDSVRNEISAPIVSEVQKTLEAMLEVSDTPGSTSASTRPDLLESKQNAVSSLLSVVDTVSTVLNMQVPMDQLDTSEKVDSLSQTISDAQNRWQQLRDLWSAAMKRLESLEVVHTILLSHVSDTEAGLVTVALTSDLLGKGLNTLAEVKRKTVKQLMTRTWFSGWLEFNALLSSSRWAQPPSLLDQKGSKDLMRVGIRVDHEKDTDVPLHMILNQGELSLTALAWMLLGYVLHGRHESNVLIIDDPFFALDPAHQRYAIEALLRATQIVNSDCQLVMSVALQDEVAEFLRRFRSCVQPRLALRASGDREDSNHVTLVYCNRESNETCRVTSSQKRLPDVYEWTDVFQHRDRPQVSDPRPLAEQKGDSSVLS